MSLWSAIWYVLSGESHAQQGEIARRLEAIEARVAKIERRHCLSKAIHDLTEGKGE